MGGEHPDWLPEDWKVSVKVRSFGRKDKYYINPSTGVTFNSKPEVLRYLKGSEKSSNPKEMNKIDVNKTVIENLPPGWVKEIRTKKIKGKTRKDRYYNDPVSGHQFRSMPEVLRFLKSKDSGEAESKPDDKGHTSTQLMDRSQSSSAEAEGQKSIGKRGDKNMIDRERTKSGPEAAPSKNAEKPLVGKRVRNVDSVAGELQNKLQKPNRSKDRQNGGRRLSKRLANNKLKDDAKDHSGSETAAENNMNIPEKKHLQPREKENSCKEETQQHEKLSPQIKRKAMKRKWVNDSPRRTSERLAHLKGDQLMEVKTSDKKETYARLSSKEEVDSTKDAATSGQSDDASTEVRTTDSEEQCRTENPTNDKQKDPIAHQNPSLEDQKHEKPLDSYLKDLLMDPCIEFAIKTLTGAIPFEDVNKVASSKQTSGSSSVSPPGDIWSDPCFEFAVKTLTGEMPAEDGLQFRNSYEKSLSSSGGSVSFSQSDADVKKVGMKQEGFLYPPFARN